jgi:NUMOD4 motif
MAVESWRPVVGWVGYYEVSTLARVRSVDRVAIRRNGSLIPIRSHILKPFRAQDGNLAVLLERHPKRSCPRIHTLVLEAFIGLPDSTHIARHNDGDIDNVALSNVKWMSSGEKITTPRKHAARKATNTRLRTPTSSRLGAIGRAAPAGPSNTTKPGNANGARLVTFQAFRGRSSAPRRERVPDEPSP